MPWMSINRITIVSEEKAMSMNHTFNDIFDDKKKACRWYQKAKHVVTQTYQALEVTLYWHMFRQKLKGNPLLVALKKILSPHDIATSKQLDICIKKYPLSEAKNSSELLQLTKSLIGLAQKNWGKQHASVQFNEKNIFDVKTAKTMINLKQPTSWIIDDGN